tara:strand:+ start:259 stop:762 length:504 start_codon:yes stop_codon:yes gene_type:complete
MVKITLRKIGRNDRVISSTIFNISRNTEKKECAKKMIQYVTESYFTRATIPGNRNTGYNDIQYFDQTNNEGRGRITDIPLAISKISEYLSQEPTNKTIDYKYINNNINRIVGSVNNRIPIHTNIPLVPGGGNMKEYIKLQSGGKRLVRYGKRGGRYYMKGGKKHYIK